MSARKPDRGEAAAPPAPQAETPPAASRPLKDPVPDRACGTCLVAVYATGSPDRDAQVAAFDRDHPEMLGHVRVRRLPDDHGDTAWGWSPGSGVPFPGARGGPGRPQGAAGGSEHAGKRPGALW